MAYGANPWELRQALAEFWERHSSRWIVQRHNYPMPEHARRSSLRKELLGE